MNVFFDAKADAVDIVFKKGKAHETREVGRDMYLDVDKEGEPLSLEILGVSERFPKDAFDNVTLNVARTANS